MGRQIQGLLYFFINDIRYSLIIFWTILLSVLIVSLAFAYFLITVENGVMAFSLTGPIYIYCAIFGFLTVKEAVPFSLKMGATRKNLFISLGIFFLALSFAKAVVGSILQEIIEGFAVGVGISTFSFLHLAYFTTDTWYTRILIDTSIIFFFLAFMFMIGLLFYKYGIAGGGIVLGILVIALLVGIAKGWVFDFFTKLLVTFNLGFFFQLLAVGILIYAVSYVFLKRITVVKVK
ncbi:hypothetical protein QGM71_11675 [Virgibacillus sp. C22-A2]|uniref:Uncharacterized protein n=1 Tax=Virgibacillus tibetensis TaxID=3042313 RepID=A0ABU6KFR1_9BACI|nr:hypothetical protein [Virgibacillus sp. C22-A2]